MDIYSELTFSQKKKKTYKLIYLNGQSDGSAQDIIFYLFDKIRLMMRMDISILTNYLKA